MLRRGFLRAAGSLAAVPAIGFTKTPPKNWHCLIGGMGRGKSTKAAKMLVDSGVDFIFCLSNTMQQVHCRQYAKLMASGLKNCKLYPLFANADGNEFWNADLIEVEISRYRPRKVGAWCCDCDPSDFHVAAGYADIAIFSSWPKYPEWRDAEFYRECIKAGTVDHGVDENLD